MTQRRHRRCYAEWLGPVLALTLLFSPPGVRAQSDEEDPEKSVIYKRDRRAIPCYIVRADNSGIFWKLDKEAKQPVKMPFSEIAFIRFRTPGGWDDATTAYSDGDYAKAIRLFKRIADEESRFSTAPGNYATQAQFWRLSGLRHTGRLKELAAEIVLFDPDLLDRNRRVEGRILFVWASIAGSDWDEASAQLDQIMTEEVSSSTQAELWFLRGLTLTRQRDFDAATRDLARVFTVGYGTSRLAQRSALRKCIEMLAVMDRKAENIPLAQLYRANYGRGALWDGADEASLLPPPPPEEESTESE